jgi:uncharacterized protein (TIGR02270 family)
VTDETTLTAERQTDHPDVIAEVVHQHADEAAGIWVRVDALAGAPHVRMSDQRRWHERLAAHLDGLAVAGDQGRPFCDSLLEEKLPGGIFVAAVRAIEEKEKNRIDRLIALASDAPEDRDALVAAFGWVEPAHLHGTVVHMLSSQNPFARVVGIAACAMHRVDPGLGSGSWLGDGEPIVRARALRAVGELGRRELLGTVIAAIADSDADCSFWAAWSAVLLGDRNRGVATLKRVGLADGPHRARAFRLALQALPVAEGHRMLQQLAGDEKQLRWLIQGSGIVGDPTYVPWLIKQMRQDKTTRIAGEAFSLITGADLAQLNLERTPPAGFEPGPNDDPEEPDVDVDPDEGLAWPDPDRVARWWDANKSRFEPGSRSFAGAPVTCAHCLEALENGRQRQRTLAAHHLCLLEPGRPLFNTGAPAWRQQRLLAQVG